MKDGTLISKPTLEQLRNELEYERSKKKSHRSGILAGVIALAVAAILIVVCMLAFPILKIYGPSMQPTLSENDYVIAHSDGKIKRGEVVAFYYDDQILVKRCIAYSGDTVEIGEDGAVKVNGVALNEPYVQQPAFGECDIELPCKVPQGHYFLMGDNRVESVDSRSILLGCVAEDQIIGKVSFRIWPLGKFGKID